MVAIDVSNKRARQEVVIVAESDDFLYVVPSFDYQNNAGLVRGNAYRVRRSSVKIVGERECVVPPALRG